MFVHAPNNSRSALYFGDALTSAAESAFNAQVVTLDQATNLSPSKYGLFRGALQRRGAAGLVQNELLNWSFAAAGAFWWPWEHPPPAAFACPSSGTASRKSTITRATCSRGRERFLTVGETDSSHSSVGRAGNLSGVRFYYAVAVDPANSRVVSRLTDGTPLLLDKKIGEGRVLLFASGLDNLTNDFPLRPSFVAFVEQTARYLSGAERQAARAWSTRVSSCGPLQEHDQTQAPGVEIVDPDGRRPLSLGEAATTQSFRLTRAGFYQIRLANGRQNVVGVNPDRRESNLDVIPDDVQALCGAAHISPNGRLLRPDKRHNRKNLTGFGVHNDGGFGGGAVGVVPGQPIPGHSARRILKREAS